MKDRFGEGAAPSCEVLGSASRDPCEWYPGANRPAYDNEVHGTAEVIVGSRGQWRLCKACARLPSFKKYKVWRLIVR